MKQQTIARLFQIACARLIGASGQSAIYHLGSALALTHLSSSPADYERGLFEIARHVKAAKAFFREARRENRITWPRKSKSIVVALPDGRSIKYPPGTAGVPVVIALTGGLTVIGYSRFEGWRVGDRFAYDGNTYQFRGVDQVGGLHAELLKQDGAAFVGVRPVVFDSAKQWTNPGRAVE